MTQSRHGIAIEYPDGHLLCKCGLVLHDNDAAQAHFAEVNSAAATVHSAEQMWADADASLDRVVAHIRDQLPYIYATAGGNTDASVVFDYMKGYIQESERTAPGNVGHIATMLFCAAAFTRLVRDDRTDASDLLAKLEKDMETGNDDH
jgi:hypothetical protein